jgi:hypothetical protein
MLQNLFFHELKADSWNRCVLWNSQQIHVKRKKKITTQKSFDYIFDWARWRLVSIDRAVPLKLVVCPLPSDSCKYNRKNGPITHFSFFFLSRYLSAFLQFHYSRYNGYLNIIHKDISISQSFAGDIFSKNKKGG